MLFGRCWRKRLGPPPEWPPDRYPDDEEQYSSQSRHDNTCKDTVGQIMATWYYRAGTRRCWVDVEMWLEVSAVTAAAAERFYLLIFWTEQTPMVGRETCGRLLTVSASSSDDNQTHGFVFGN